jgi:hypothetical protein
MSVLAVIVAVQPLSLSRAQEEDEEPGYSVRLDLAKATRLGIRVAPLKAAEFRDEVRGFGVILAFDALAQTDRRRKAVVL